MTSLIPHTGNGTGVRKRDLEELDAGSELRGAVLVDAGDDGHLVPGGGQGGHRFGQALSTPLPVLSGFWAEMQRMRMKVLSR